MQNETLNPGDPQWTETQLHFGHFAEIPEYRQVNEQLVERLFQHLPNPFVLVDVATGTGLVPQLLIEKAERLGYSGTIIGIDPNPDSLEIVEERTPESQNLTTEFILGFGQETDRLVTGKIVISDARPARRQAGRTRESMICDNLLTRSEIVLKKLIGTFLNVSENSTHSPDRRHQFQNQAPNWPVPA